MIISLFSKIWLCVTCIQLFFGIFSLGIGFMLGPVMLWSAFVDHNPEHWDVTLSFGGVGLLLTTNLVSIIVGEFSELK